jgi:hypothetical protein
MKISRCKEIKITKPKEGGVYDHIREIELRDLGTK